MFRKQKNSDLHYRLTCTYVLRVTRKYYASANPLLVPATLARIFGQQRDLFYFALDLAACHGGYPCDDEEKAHEVKAWVYRMQEATCPGERRTSYRQMPSVQQRVERRCRLQVVVLLLILSAQCDETRPSCLNCRAANLSCPYRGMQPTRLSMHDTHASDQTLQEDTISQPSPLQAATPIQPLSISTSPSAVAACSDSDTIHHCCLDISLVHLRLFHHFLTQSCKTFCATLQHIDLYREVVANQAFAQPFLMCEMLAFAAMHLSLGSVDGPEKAHFQSLSMSLQTKALTAFHEALPDLDSGTCMAFVLFSHLIGLHSFCTTVVVREGSIGGFLSRLAQTAVLMRGIRSIVIPWWTILLTSDLGPLFQVAHTTLQAAADIGPGTDQLLALLEQTDLGEQTRQVYVTAVKDLQVQLSVSTQTDDLAHSTYSAFTWLVTTPLRYGELLEERRPEALALLAWFSVVLHYHRHSWIVGDSGRYLFDLIDAYLGTRWEAWLSWPRSQVYSDTSII